MEKVEQQKQWLIEVYPELMAVAMRLTQNVIKAEDAVSDAVVSALCQIQAYKCKATEMAQFCAWLRTIVRNRCKTRLKRGSYDLPTDIGAEKLRHEVRPDKKIGTSATTDDAGWIESAYTRTEDVE